MVTKCPSCGTGFKDKVLHTTVDGIEREALICPRCEHGWIENPVNSDNLEELYNDLESYQVVIPPRASLKLKRIGQYLKKMSVTGRNILDIGCGAGDFLFNLDSSWNKNGVELMERRAEVARKFTDAKISQKLIEKSDFPLGSFDCVTMVALLEHIVSPKDMLRQIYNLLKPGGIIYIITCDRTSWKARIEKGHWYLYTPPEHYHFFSPQSLQELLQKAGFEVKNTEWRMQFGYRTQIPIIKHLDRIMTLGLQGACEYIPILRKIHFGDNICVLARKPCV